ncbi:MAG: class I SAM-dependent methyltransferase [Pleurocapsa sp.]
MDTKTSIDLGDVQETLLIPLWARAEEFKQENAIIRVAKPCRQAYRTSAEMMAAIDYDFAKFAKDRSNQVSCCLRGYLMDDWVKKYIQQYPQGVVVELGAGLNTRFERLDNGRIRWFDLDLADTMTLRQKFFRETERCKFITSSALDTDLCDLVRAKASGEPCLFVAE